MKKYTITQEQLQSCITILGESPAKNVYEVIKTLLSLRLEEVLEEARKENKDNGE